MVSDTYIIKWAVLYPTNPQASMAQHQNVELQELHR
ncbi:unnamed protein product [Paramecium primaurelia]|uniref:Uncharacterized protein n=1 Tax=Paramecium primaurelia TaxID=5886 RepID=A0A8S1KVR0_PARPR|nr:unnamed protein product [Paramecium primaurelia]